MPLFTSPVDKMRFAIAQGAPRKAPCGRVYLGTQGSVGACEGGVARARAIAPRPQILLADEPTGNLDSATGESVINTLFAAAAAADAALVLVTHDAGLAKRCSRVLHIEDGLLVYDSAAAS